MPNFMQAHVRYPSHGQFLDQSKLDERSVCKMLMSDDNFDDVRRCDETITRDVNVNH